MKKKKNHIPGRSKEKEKKKGRGNVQESKRREKMKKERKMQQQGKKKIQKKKKKRNILNAAHVPVESAHEDFCHLSLNFPSSIFLPILVRKLFGGPEEKILEFHHYFLPSLSQPNTIKKVFIPHFFHPLKSTTKHTINVINFFNFPLKIMVDQLFL